MSPVVGLALCGYGLAFPRLCLAAVNPAGVSYHLLAVCCSVGLPGHCGQCYRITQVATREIILYLFDSAWAVVSVIATSVTHFRWRRALRIKGTSFRWHFRLKESVRNVFDKLKAQRWKKIMHLRKKKHYIKTTYCCCHLFAYKAPFFTGKTQGLLYFEDKAILFPVVLRWVFTNLMPLCSQLSHRPFLGWSPLGCLFYRPPASWRGTEEHSGRCFSKQSDDWPQDGAIRVSKTSKTTWRFLYKAGKYSLKIFVFATVVTNQIVLYIV